jgi:predicted PurR-regulated permease PerM
MVPPDHRSFVTSEEEEHSVEVDEGEESPAQASVAITSRFQALRTSLREGVQMREGITQFRGYVLPAVVLTILGTILVTFRTILLPFIFACVIVYLMEPIVSRLSRSHEHPGRPPRWTAVILVYLVAIGLIVTFLVAVVPRFVSEIVRFGETAPKMLHDFRAQQLPGMNEQVQKFVQRYMPEPTETPAVGRARNRVAEARVKGARVSLAYGSLEARLHIGYDQKVRWVPAEGEESGGGAYAVETSGTRLDDLSLSDSLTSATGWRFGREQQKPIVRLESNEDGSVDVFLNEVDLTVELQGDKTWSIRRQQAQSLPPSEGAAIDQVLNLERRFDDVVKRLVSTSSTKFSALIGFAQKIVAGILEVFVGLILTLMVAAFMSIDLDRVWRFFRDLVPRNARSSFDQLLSELDKGLAGVVRGQLAICVINGTLTYIGLAFLDVKFSVLLAFVAGVLSLIPVFGTVISTIPIVLIGLTDGFRIGILSLIWILAIHFVEANILNPKIIGTSAHIHPVIVIFALLAGESAYGLVGALLAVPTASILLTIFGFLRKILWGEEELENSPQDHVPVVTSE